MTWRLQGSEVMKASSKALGASLEIAETCACLLLILGEVVFNLSRLSFLPFPPSTARGSG
jgi:hypothetical protein